MDLTYLKRHLLRLDTSTMDTRQQEETILSTGDNSEKVLQPRIMDWSRVQLNYLVRRFRRLQNHNHLI